MNPANRNVTCREWTANDVKLEFELYASAREEEIEAWGWTEAQGRAFLQMQFDAQQRSYRTQYPQAQTQIIVVDEEPSGRIVVDRTALNWRLIDIALFSDYRGQGIGSQLIGALLVEAEAHKRNVQLHVWKGNPAQRLYERLGFQISGDDGAYFLMDWSSERGEALVEKHNSN